VKAVLSVDDIPAMQLVQALAKAKGLIARNLGKAPAEITLTMEEPAGLTDGELVMVIRRRVGKWAVDESVTVERFTNSNGELWLDPLSPYDDGFAVTRDGPFARLEYLMEHVAARVAIKIEGDNCDLELASCSSSETGYS
jgi:hypothetical protein